jgi:hypothetical protein
LYVDPLAADELRSRGQESRAKDSRKKRQLLAGSNGRELPFQDFT